MSAKRSFEIIASIKELLSELGCHIEPDEQKPSTFPGLEKHLLLLENDLAFKHFKIKELQDMIELFDKQNSVQLRQIVKMEHDIDLLTTAVAKIIVKE